MNTLNTPDKFKLSGNMSAFKQSASFGMPNYNFMGLEYSAQKYFPFMNFDDVNLKSAKTFGQELTKSLNFNEFLQLFTKTNNSNEDYLKFLNLNSNKKSGFGINTAISNNNNNNEEGDFLKKKRKIEERKE